MIVILTIKVDGCCKVNGVVGKKESSGWQYSIVNGDDGRRLVKAEIVDGWALPPITPHTSKPYQILTHTTKYHFPHSNNYRSLSKSLSKSQ